MLVLSVVFEMEDLQISEIWPYEENVHSCTYIKKQNDTTCKASSREERGGRSLNSIHHSALRAKCTENTSQTCYQVRYYTILDAQEIDLLPEARRHRDRVNEWENQILWNLLMEYGIFFSKLLHSPITNSVKILKNWLFCWRKFLVNYLDDVFLVHIHLLF